jgi:tRNA U55 pseudouridine synthase TruB
MDIQDINHKNYYNVPEKWRSGLITRDNYDALIPIDDLKRGTKLLLYKPLGVTPKELADMVRDKVGAEKASFSSRLDPVAHGTMVVIINDRDHFSAVYDAMNKVYHFKLIAGVFTDTADINGVVTHTGDPSSITRELLCKNLDILSKRTTQIRPMHSSTTIMFEGKKRPLWYVFNKIGKIPDPPTKECQILKYSVDSIENIEDNDQLLTEIIRRINLIDKRHTFRQDQTIPTWESTSLPPNLKLIDITVEVTSGFYIRQLTNDLSELTGIPMCLFEIYRNYLGN